MALIESREEERHYESISMLERASKMCSSQTLGLLVPSRCMEIPLPYLKRMADIYKGSWMGQVQYVKSYGPRIASLKCCTDQAHQRWRRSTERDGNVHGSKVLITETNGGLANTKSNCCDDCASSDSAR